MATFANNRTNAVSWRQGYAAQQAGKPTTDCPIMMNDQQAIAWRAGWDKAHQDATYGEVAEWTDDPDDENYHPDCDPFALDETELSDLEATRFERHNDDKGVMTWYCSYCNQPIGPDTGERVPNASTLTMLEQHHQIHCKEFDDGQS